MRRAISNNRYPVKSLLKALHILDVLADKPDGCGITGLSEFLGIGKSTVHRLLATLKEEDYVVLHPVTSRYMLGSRIAKLGQQLSTHPSLFTFGAPIIQRLAREYNETVNMAILEGTEVVYVAGEESKEILHNSFVVGYRAPAHSTALGKVLLSDLTEEEIRRQYGRRKQLTQVTPRTIGSLEKLLIELSTVGQAGFAYDNEESGWGVSCVAAPVRDSSGRIVAAVSFSMPKQRMTASRRPILRDALLQVCPQLSQALGFTQERKTRRLG